MATPLSPSRLLTALRAEGCHAVEYRSWHTHNRNHKGPWGPVNGIVIHHTAGTNSLGLCYNGTASLPGPLCHTHLSKTGIATMVSAGRANHAGTFAANAHQAVIAEATTHPRPDPGEPVDGNRHYYGIEIENLGNGRDPYPPAQYDQAVRWAAGICRAHGWTADSVIGHKEGTLRKIDPTFDMNRFRADVAERLKHPAGWDSSAASKEDNMPTQRELYNGAWELDGVMQVPWGTDTNPHWKPKSVLIHVGEVARENRGRIKAMQAELSALHATVRTLAEALATRDSAVDVDALMSRIEERLESVTVRLDVTPEGEGS